MTSPRPLTDRQRDALLFLARHIEREGYAPTIRELGRALGIRSTNGVSELLDALERRGLIRRAPRLSRALSLTELGALHTTNTEPADEPTPEAA